jgi:catechol 2,3-dioxygenase-like lactoylglutathione lyase family enzyme
MAIHRISRRVLLGGVSAICPVVMFDSLALAQGLKGDEIPLQTTGLEHIGMVVPDVEEAARFYSRVFNPDIRKEHELPLRYYVTTGCGHIAIGGRATVTESKIDHYGTLVRGYDRERVVTDPDGIGLQLIALPGGPGSTAVACGRLVDEAPLVKPMGFDSIVLKVANVRRSADFYSQFFNSARTDEAGPVAFEAADTRIVLRATTPGENPGVDRYVMRVESFRWLEVLNGVAALGATPEDGWAGVVRFRDPNGLRVELRSV